MKKLIFVLALLFSTFASSEEIDAPKMKVISFSQLGPAASLPLNMTIPEDYIWVRSFADLAGVVVLCAGAEESLIAQSGDFSRAKNAVISLRQSASDYYDTAKKTFSFERSIESELRNAGAKNYRIEKSEIKGLPVAIVTFEVGERKLYSLAIAQGSMVYRLSYNARSKPRAYDDAVWSALVKGL